jgi:hypothetical protein
MVGKALPRGLQFLIWIDAITFPMTVVFQLTGRLASWLFWVSLAFTFILIVAVRVLRTVRNAQA